MPVPSVYVGKTTRSVQEDRDSFRSRKKDSHIYKHWQLHHQSEGEPQFIMKAVQHHKSALNRQVSEAIRIRRRDSPSAAKVSSTDVQYQY